MIVVTNGSSRPSFLGDEVPFDDMLLGTTARRASGIEVHEAR
jgi:hypothetical protein